MTLAKVICSGETGAQRGALEASQVVGISTGGHAHSQFLTSKGKDRDLQTKFGLTPLPGSREKRDRRNIDDADGVLVFCLRSQKLEPALDKVIAYALSARYEKSSYLADADSAVSHRSGTQSQAEVEAKHSEGTVKIANDGTHLPVSTLDASRYSHRKSLVIRDVHDDRRDEVVNSIVSFVRESSVTTLAVFGHSEKTVPGFTVVVRELLIDAFRQVQFMVRFCKILDQGEALHQQEGSASPSSAITPRPLSKQWRRRPKRKNTKAAATSTTDNSESENRPEGVPKPQKVSLSIKPEEGPSRVNTQPKRAYRQRRVPRPVSRGSGAASKKPEAPQRAVDVLAVLDFEATCYDDKRSFKQEIIEFPVILIDAKTGAQIGDEFHFYLKPQFHPQLSPFCTELTGITQFLVILINARTGAEIGDEFHLYLKPQFHPQLSPFCTELTGITQDMVNGGSDLVTVLAALGEFLKSNNLQTSEEDEDAKFDVNAREGNSAPRSFAFVTCGDWDLKTCLPNHAKYLDLDLPPYLSRWVNIKRVFDTVEKKRSRGMMSMLRELGIQHRGRHHSGIDDVRNIVEICRHFIRKRPRVKFFPRRNLVFR